jgi:hypothetical protein
MSITPFTNGTAYEIFMSHNCFKCKKYDFNEKTYRTTCRIIEAIENSKAGAPPLSKYMATRMGYLDKQGKEIEAGMTPNCTEFVQGEPGKKQRPYRPPAPLDKQLKKAGYAVLPGFED